MRKHGCLLIGLLLLFSCGEPEPRRPVQVRSGSFMKASVARSKKLLEYEQQQILEIIQRDSLQDYHSSPFGFWYYYETQEDTAGYQPKTNDVVLLTYNLMTLSGDTLYPAEDIGLVQHAIDKSQLFPGLRNAIKLLRKGEKATFLFPSSQGYGYKGDNHKIGSNIPLKSSLALLDIQKDSSNLNKEP